MKNREKACVMTAGDMERALRRMSSEILERNHGCDNLLVIGIQRRGVYLAARVREYLREAEGVKVPLGELDITLYRDDLSPAAESPQIGESLVPFPIEGKTVVLVDDVIYTGRTARAAMEAVIRIARPARIQLVEIIDRGHRELPIRPEYVGKNIPTSAREIVAVCLPETDGKCGVELYEQ